MGSNILMIVETQNKMIKVVLYTILGILVVFIAILLFRSGGIGWCVGLHRCPKYNSVLGLITYERDHTPILKAMIKRKFFDNIIVGLSDGKKLGFVMDWEVNKYLSSDRFRLSQKEGGTIYLPDEAIVLNINTLKERQKFLITKYKLDSVKKWSEAVVEFPSRCDMGFQLEISEKGRTILRFSCIREDKSGVNVLYKKEHVYFDPSNMISVDETETVSKQQFKDLVVSQESSGNTQAISTPQNGETVFAFGKVKISSKNHFEGVGEFGGDSNEYFTTTVEDKGTQIYSKKTINDDLWQIAFSEDMGRLYLLYFNGNLDEVIL